MAISDQLTTLNGIKSDIKAAIIAKGGTATDDFTTYATAISNLPSGGGGDDLKDLIEGDISGSFTIPSGTTNIRNSAFHSCSGLTSMTIPNSVTSIGNNAFHSCSGLTSMTIPNSVTSIGNNAFNGCSGLTSMTIPNSVTSIGGFAFYDCTGLASITIGSGVTNIGNYFLQQCTSLTSITCLATTPPTLSNFALNAFPATCPIYVPAASVETYKAANVWSTRASYIQAIPTS